MHGIAGHAQVCRPLSRRLNNGEKDKNTPCKKTSDPSSYSWYEQLPIYSKPTPVPVSHSTKVPPQPPCCLPALVQVLQSFPRRGHPSLVLLLQSNLVLHSVQSARRVVESLRKIRISVSSWLIAGSQTETYLSISASLFSFSARIFNNCSHSSSSPSSSLSLPRSGLKVKRSIM